MVKKKGKSYADVVKKREKQLSITPEGLHASHWWSTAVDLPDFISRVSRREVVITSLLGWPLRNRLSLKVSWCPVGSVPP